MTNVKNKNDKNEMEKLCTVYTIDIDEAAKSKEKTTFVSMMKLMAAETYEEAEKVVNESNDPIIKELFEDMLEFMSRDYVQEYARKLKEEENKNKNMCKF